ncbi:MAG: hypothetical protein ACOC0D_05345, partial [Spirochaeta sp.]
MKTLVWFVCAAVLLLSGCEGQGAASSADTQADAMSVEEETVDSYSSMRAWYYIEKSDAKGETTFGENAGYIEAGEPVALLRDGELQSHEADGRPLLPAKLDGEDIWVSAYFIGQGTRRAAIAAEDPATVYTGLDIVDNTRYSLTRGQQITVFPQTSEEAKSGRIRFFGYDLELGNGETENFGRYSRGSEWYLSEDAVTTSDDDVAVLDYLAVIDSRPVDLQLEPLQILEQENTDSTFH